MKLPSKSPSEALALCVAAYGERSEASARTITSANRNLVKQWLVANGVASASASSFALDTLREIWADHTDGVLNIWRNAQPAPVPAIPSDASEATRADTATDDAAENLVKAIQALTVQRAKVAPLDEARVLHLIQQHAKKTVRHEITFQGKTASLDGEIFHPCFPEVLAAISAGLNVLLVGPAGSGKTHLAEQVAKALSFDFSFTGAVMQEHKLLGFRNPMGEVVRTAFRERYEHGGIFLFDEMDGSSAQALLAFNAGLANGQQDFPDGCIARHENFRVIASANTYGTGADRQYVGRNQLDAASLDRFYVIPMDYCEATERAIYSGGNVPAVSLYKPRRLSDTERADWTAYVHKTRASVARLGLRHVVSARAIASGLKSLAAGIPRATVERAVIWKNLPAADIQKIKGAV